MSFGQQSGPPASDKQVQYLLALVRKAGYTDFREARHPMSLNQRQAKGKFTRLEASELIDRLLGDDEGAGADDDESPEPELPRPAPARGRTLRELPLERLVAELERRGYRVVPADQDGSIP